ncbi:YjgP/YjgQ family permease [Thermosipho sp. 1074]|uniref:YjgP/YjgQ family permease n=1 Tax=Thermosipho sp. 1074 TaxID=1643331 RepID=UPI0009846AFD|nr:YjgP/YjgQ family permease [Thermosipho sp. 1074]OOC42274.1 permease [Thermosipho sp. 1074]
MKVLTKYVSKLSIGPFLMGVGAFVLFASVELLYQLSDIIVRHRVSILKLFELVYYNLPYFVSMGIPVGVLFSIFWVLSQLYNSKEITALLVHGIPSRKLVYPFFMLSILFGIFAFYLNDQVVPSFNHKAMETISRYVYKKPEISIRENVLTKIDDSQYFFVKRYDQSNGILYNVVLFQNVKNEERIITAQKVIKEDSKWFLINGRMYITDNDGFLKLDVNFSKIKLNLKEDLESLMRFGKSPRDMTGEELKNKIRTFKKLGIDPAPWIVELHSRYANSIGPFIIAILGVPLSLLFGLKSKSWSVIFTFSIVVLYQGSGAWISAMGKENLMEPVLAAWFPNLIFATVGVFLFFLLDTPFAYKIRELFSKFLVLFFVAFISGNMFSETVNMEASSLIYNEGSVYAMGNVHISWDENLLISDEATIFVENLKAKVIEAYGNVQYVKEGKKYNARYVKYFFSEKNSYALKVRGIEKYKSKEKKIDLYFGAENFTDNSSMVLLNEAYVTTCELKEPHYKVESLDVYIYEGKYLVAENSVLLILNFPVFPYPIYFWNLDKNYKSPFSFSFSLDNGFNLSTKQEYNMYVDNYLLSTKLETGESSNLIFEIQDEKRSILYVDYKKQYLTLNFRNFNYITRWDEKYTNLKFQFYPFYYNGLLNYNTWSKKFGLNFKGKSFWYDIGLILNVNSIVLNNFFSVKNIDEKLYFFNFHINNVNFNTQMKKEIANSTFTISETGIFDFYFKDKLYTTRFSGSLRDDNYISRVSHSFKLPFEYKSEFLDSKFKYSFELNYYNALTDKYYLNLELSDIYELSSKLKLKVLEIQPKYSYKKSFRSEREGYNKFNLDISVKGNYMTFSLIQGYDFLEKRSLNDKISLKYFLGKYFSMSFSSEYDFGTQKLLPTTVKVNYFNSKFSLKYSLIFKYYHNDNVPIKEITHFITFQKLKGRLLQSVEENYIKNAYFKGSFKLNDMLNILEFNYVKNDITKHSVYSIKYNLKKGKDSFGITYKLDNLYLNLALKSFDPGLKFEVNYDFNEERVKDLKLTFLKKLHHWMFEFSSCFNFNNDGNFDFEDVEKFSVLFYIVEFDEKFLGWDFKENAPSIGIF